MRQELRKEKKMERKDEYAIGFFYLLKYLHFMFVLYAPLKTVEH